MTITKQTVMGDMLNYDGGIALVLMEAGMHCVSCPAALMETLAEASIVHGIPVDELMQYIKERLDQEDAQKEAQ